MPLVARRRKLFKNLVSTGDNPQLTSQKRANPDPAKQLRNLVSGGIGAT
jgi:hypothetical protein